MLNLNKISQKKNTTLLIVWFNSYSSCRNLDSYLGQTLNIKKLSCNKHIESKWANSVLSFIITFVKEKIRVARCILHLHQTHFRIYAVFFCSPHTHQNLYSGISSDVICCLFLQWSGLKERFDSQSLYKTLNG